MEFLVDMATNVPEGTADATVADTVAREAVRAAELARQAPHPNDPAGKKA